MRPMTLSVESLLDDDARAGFGRLAGADLRHGVARVGDPLDHDLQSSPPLSFSAEQASLYDLGVVEDQQIAGSDQFREVAELQIVAFVLFDVQQSACGTVRGKGVGRSARPGAHSRSRRVSACDKNSRRGGLSVGPESRIIRPPSVRLMRTMAEVAESVDAADSKSAVEKREGSSPSLGTTSKFKAYSVLLCLVFFHI